VQGQLYHGQLLGVPVSLTVGEQGFSLRTQQDGLLELPFAEASMKAGGDGDIYLILGWPNGAEIYFDRRQDPIAQLRAHSAPFAFVAQLEQLDAKTTVASRSRFAKTAAVIGTIVTALVLCLFNLPTFVMWAIPPSVEVSLGQSVKKDLKLKPTQAPILQETVEEIGRRLLAAAPNQPYPFEFHVSDDPIPNAFATPGGVVVVNTGLIEILDGPDELAGIIGHEISHVLQRHGLRQAVKSLGTYGALAILTGGSETVSMLSTSILSKAYSRGDENDADEKGLELVYRASIDPHGVPNALEKLHRYMEAQGYGDGGGYLSTHPATGERVALMRRRADALPARIYEPIEVDWDEVKTAASAVSGG